MYIEIYVYRNMYIEIYVYTDICVCVCVYIYIADSHCCTAETNTTM